MNHECNEVGWAVVGPGGERSMMKEQNPQNLSSTCQSPSVVRAQEIAWDFHPFTRFLLPSHPSFRCNGSLTTASV